jgi:hypothetical protein
VSLCVQPNAWQNFITDVLTHGVPQQVKMVLSWGRQVLQVRESMPLAYPKRGGVQIRAFTDSVF